MKVRVIVGEVEIRTEGITLTKRQVLSLLREAAGIAVLAASIGGEEPDARQAPIGFTAHMERAPDELADPYYDDEE